MGILIIRACHGPALVGRPILFSCRRPRPGPAHQFSSPSTLKRMGYGKAQPINFSDEGPRPGPARHTFRRWAAAQPGPSNSFFFPGPVRTMFFFNCRPGPARFIAFAAKPMRYGPYMGRPAISVGRPVDLKGRPMCYPVLKSSYKGAP